MEEVIATPQSLKQARNIQDEIATKGGYELSGMDEHSVIYSLGPTHSDSIIEKLVVRKRGQRQWAVVKIVE